MTGSLLKTVESTTPVEPMIEIVRHHARRVKHCQHGGTATGVRDNANQVRPTKCNDS